MFYDEFVKLCDAKDVSRTKACIDCGISRTAWHKWESGAMPNGATLNRFADYFGVSVDYLLGTEKEKAPAQRQEPTEDDLKAAFFGGYSDDLPQEDIDALWEDAKDYARFKAAQLKRKGGKK